MIVSYTRIALITRASLFSCSFLLLEPQPSVVDALLEKGVRQVTALFLAAPSDAQLLLLLPPPLLLLHFWGASSAVNGSLGLPPCVRRAYGAPHVAITLCVLLSSQRDVAPPKCMSAAVHLPSAVVLSPPCPRSCTLPTAGWTAARQWPSTSRCARGAGGVPYQPFGALG